MNKGAIKQKDKVRGNLMWLIHSAKGTTWKDHKYIAIKNGRYIYPNDNNKKGTTSANSNSIAIPKDHISKNYALEDYARVGKDIYSTTKMGAKTLYDAWNKLDPEQKNKAKDIVSSIMAPGSVTFVKDMNRLNKSVKEYKKNSSNKKVLKKEPAIYSARSKY